MDLGLAGRQVLVTGASKGIGFACARSFAREGSRVVLVARDPARLESAAAELRGVAAAYPDIDVLVNNAGAIPGGGLLDLSMARWTEAWQLKVFGYIHMTQLCLAAMKARGHGTIVNVIGMAGQLPRYDYICGSAGNAALIAFTQAVGARAVDWGVRVVGINPSATRTDRIVELMKTRAAASGGDESLWADHLQDLPLSRLAEADEIGDAAAFLASPRAGYLSGTVVDIDAGSRFRASA